MQTEKPQVVRVVYLTGRSVREQKPLLEGLYFSQVYWVRL